MSAWRVYVPKAGYPFAELKFIVEHLQIQQNEWTVIILSLVKKYESKFLVHNPEATLFLCFLSASSLLSIKLLCHKHNNKN